MLEWLKWKIAGREMAELERWRVQWHEARRYLGEFDDARDALDHLRQEVDGVRPFCIMRLRDNMRARRAENDSNDALNDRIERAFSRGARLTDHRFKLGGGE